MNLTEYLRIGDGDLQRFEDLYARYRLLHQAPDRCRPMLIVTPPVENLPPWEERLADPLTMLKAELDQLRPHLKLEDDAVPTVRVQFGTAQVAAAFGCAMHVPPNNLPAAGSHVLASAEDVYTLKTPTLDAGWYGKLAEWTALWRDNLPQGVHIQHPDIQSAFNTAHLIRGNDILTDFYDHPHLVEALLDRVTDFMIDITRHVKRAISDDPAWFFDWGALWRGAARISNCSMHLIGPSFYRDHVLPRDIRFFESMGGGRMHYCGTAGAVLDEFCKIPSLSGLDVDLSHHDFFELCTRLPGRIAFLGSLGSESRELRRLLSGDWPRKRNLVLSVHAPSLEAGRTLLARLRASIPY